MALAQLGNSDVYVDKSLVSAKTPVKQKYSKDVWYFRLLIDGVWFYLEYAVENDADVEWATYT